MTRWKDRRRRQTAAPRCIGPGLGQIVLHEEKAVIADASGAQNELASLEESEETKKGEGEMSCTKGKKEDKRRRNDIKDD